MRAREAKSWLVLGLGVVCVGVFAVSRSASTHTIPRPSLADSLAGVVARVLDRDSAAVARVRWRESNDSILGWNPGRDYDYRGAVSTVAPLRIVAKTRLWYLGPLAPTITFARGYAANAAVIKHELAHVLLRTTSHPAAAFRAVETYSGR